jgi:hypothetical protein
VVGSGSSFLSVCESGSCVKNECGSGYRSYHHVKKQKNFTDKLIVEIYGK